MAGGALAVLLATLPPGARAASAGAALPADAPRLALCEALPRRLDYGAQAHAETVDRAARRAQVNGSAWRVTGLSLLGGAAAGLAVWGVTSHQADTARIRFHDTLEVERRRRLAEEARSKAELSRLSLGVASALASVGVSALVVGYLYDRSVPRIDPSRLPPFPEALPAEVQPQVDAAFSEARTRCGEGAYAEAAGALQRAWRLAAHDELLFHVAALREAAGLEDAAAGHYRLYLAAPNRRPALEGRARVALASLEERGRAEQERLREEQEVREARAEAERRREEARRERLRRAGEKPLPRWPAFTALAVSGTSLAVGSFALALSHGARQDFGSTLSLEERRSATNTARVGSQVATVSFGAAALSASVGAWLYWLSLPSSQEPGATSLNVVPLVSTGGAGGAALTFQSEW